MAPPSGYNFGQCTRRPLVRGSTGPALFVMTSGAFESISWHWILYQQLSKKIKTAHAGFPDAGFLFVAHLSVIFPPDRLSMTHGTFTLGLWTGRKRVSFWSLVKSESAWWYSWSVFRLLYFAIRSVLTVLSMHSPVNGFYFKALGFLFRA